jgi:ectoine utilization protein EutC
MPIRVLNEAETRSLITPAEAIARCRDAYARLARGRVEQPDVLTIEVKEHKGEVHAKGGYLHGEPWFSIKVATGFYDNPALGLPVTSGAVWVFSARTGRLELILLDNGYLTELRTGAAGAVAADLLARPVVDTAGIVGAGGQARYQLEALLQVRTPRRILVAGRDGARTRAYAEEMSARIGRRVEVASTVEELVRSSDLIVTCTPADTPVIHDAWVRPGSHITAMGSDMPHKRELETGLLRRAKVVADRLSQCLTQGEVHHAVAEGVLRPEDVYAELGEIAAGLKPGRTSDSEITVADQTGVGALDAAVANLVAERATRSEVGRWLEA